VILLDTNALIWLNLGLSQLGPGARRTADEALLEGRLAVSAVSFWEVAVLVERRRVELDRSIDRWHQDLLQSGLIEVPLDGRIAITAIGLPGLHGDPADRFIAATAILNEARLITADRRLLNWSGPLECLDART
jgi:PIN domain nuclease of toxin-antitoxin system